MIQSSFLQWPIFLEVGVKTISTACKSIRDLSSFPHLPATPLPLWHHFILLPWQVAWLCLSYIRFPLYWMNFPRCLHGLSLHLLQSFNPNVTLRRPSLATKFKIAVPLTPNISYLPFIFALIKYQHAMFFAVVVFVFFVLTSLHSSLTSRSAEFLVSCVWHVVNSQ